MMKTMGVTMNRSLLEQARGRLDRNNAIDAFVYAISTPQFTITMPELSEEGRRLFLRRT